MKKLITFCLIGLTILVKGQGFEGSINWTMKMDITDPKTKAEMERAQKEMSDPANQEKIKELEKQMSDPQFKAQMDANPQMKAQMEQMLKAMKGGGGGPGGMMPSGMKMKVKGNNTITKMEGGMMAGYELLHQGDKNQSFRIDRENKTYTAMNESKTGNAEPNKVKFTKTSETGKVLGYNCTKYIGEMMERGKPVKQTFWTTTEIKDIDMKALTRQRMGPGGNSLLPEGLEGVPLKIELAMPQGNMIMEVTEIKRESFPESDFTIPSDFKKG